jgi:type I restriction enzyme S subunit
MVSVKDSVMSRKFQIKTVPSSWLENTGRRLDSGPYMSGGIEAKEFLRKIRKDPLAKLTVDIFHAGRESRIWVKSPEHGVPFMSSTDIMASDLSYLPLISKKQIDSNPKFTIKKGWTLITRSGTVGRMSFVRPDMDGLACSEHVLRVVPDTSKIKPGYLYAFLSSRFGVPLVVSGTYGAIIQHIEPHHIADLPVPRLGEVEDQAHELIQGAADSLSESSKLMQEATTQLLTNAGLEESRNHHYLADNRRQGWIESNFNAFSLRALNYDPRAKELWKAVESINHSRLGDIVSRENFEGYIVFSRIDCEPEYGSLLVGQREAFFLRPTGRWISKKSIQCLGLVVPAKTTVVPCQGTLGELGVYCRAIYVTERCSKYAYSGDFFRCAPIEGGITHGYLYAFLRSRCAFRMMRSISIGSMQQHQPPQKMASFPVPRLERHKEQEIGTLVDRAAYLQDHSLELEDQAYALVERAIESRGR